ncbi:MAG: hypothetical protein RLZZ09_2609, partial [Pseudomonadota bacterium]
MTTPILMAITLDKGPNTDLGIDKFLDGLRAPVKRGEMGDNLSDCFILPKYEATETFIEKIYAKVDNINRSLSRDETLRCYILLENYNKENKNLITNTFLRLSRLIMQEGPLSKDSESLRVYPTKVYVTHSVYDALLPKYQDLYHMPQVLGGITLHKRFSRDAQRCFIISPIGPEGSEIRKRADYVFSKYIKPACEATHFRPVRGDMLPGQLVTTEMLQAINSDPIVIAYLGAPYPALNNNVMMEIGGRVISNSPMVVIKDATYNGEIYDLPFDFNHLRIVDIPEGEEPSESQTVTIINTIFSELRARTIDDQWTRVYPVATIDIEVGSEDGISRYVEASKEMEDLFETTGLVGQ